LGGDLAQRVALLLGEGLALLAHAQHCSEQTLSANSGRRASMQQKMGFCRRTSQHGRMLGQAVPRFVFWNGGAPC